jgi:hypothetical protein
MGSAPLHPNPQPSARTTYNSTQTCRTADRDIEHTSLAVGGLLPQGVLRLGTSLLSLSLTWKGSFYDLTDMASCFQVGKPGTLPIFRFP